MTIAAPLHVGKFIPPPFAGIEAHVDTLLTALAPDLPVTLVACRPPWQRIRPAPTAYRMVVASSFGKFASVAVSPDILWRIGREFASQRCNLLHLHAPNPWGDIAALNARSGLPIVLSWHSDIVRQQGLLRGYRAIQRRVLERADRIVVFTPSHYTSSSQLHQIDVSRKIEVVPMGIDVSRLDGSLVPLSDAVERFIAGRRVVLTIGRHVYYKGYEHLIDAFAGVDGEAVLLMVGTGPLSESLARRIVERGQDRRIALLGEVDEATLVALLHRCDVFTLPSIAPSEAFGIASAEAMACGKPTVVCELGNGVNHLNRDAVTSLTVPPRDVAALREALDRLLVDDALRLDMGRQARRWVREEFSVARMAERTKVIYSRLM
jgi:rhamnosyl/mannosyltransferase